MIDKIKMLLLMVLLATVVAGRAKDLQLNGQEYFERRGVNGTITY